MDIVIEGRAWVFGDNINTDIISPPQYLELSIADSSRYAMSAVRPEFATLVRPGDILVAGANLGSGSSRETSPLTLRHLGIRAIIAQSFARIFYRNCINLGLPALECVECGRIGDGSRVRVEIGRGVIVDGTRNEIYRFVPLPTNIMDMIEAGGLIPYLKGLRQAAHQE
jgi:3-isopropylmalate/(R)-2-methylmalate dehydratase small subunit